MSVEWILRSRRRSLPQNPEWTFRGLYYKREGCWTGPISSEEVARLLRKKRLRRSERFMEVWKNGERTQCHYCEAGAVLAGAPVRVPS
jgi:hypothetical protein